jgi:hypothetical protein
MFKRRGELPLEERDRRSVRHKCVDSDITGPQVPAEGEAQDVAVAFDRDQDISESSLVARISTRPWRPMFEAEPLD